MNLFCGALFAWLSFVSSGNAFEQDLKLQQDQTKLAPGVQKSVWDSFKLNNAKAYSKTGEEEHRRLVYQQNSLAIAEWNERFKLGQVTFTMGENEYSDLTDEEFDRMKNLKLPRKILQEAIEEALYDSNANNVTEIENVFELIAARNLPLNCTLDLRTDPCLVAVKNQKKCGSCYAFPATCLVEYAFCKRKNLKAAISFSEQQCVDCTRRFGNHGCDGGYYEGCFNYWKTKKITSSVVYPYTAKAARCKLFGSPGYCNVGAYTTLTRWNEAMIETVLCTFKQPIAVAIHATKLFDSYKSGVFTDPTCANYPKNNRTTVNHGVTIVGIGTDSNGTKYWTIRNSWGATWGEKGYMRIKRDENMCNIGINPCMVHL